MTHGDTLTGWSKMMHTCRTNCVAVNWQRDCHQSQHSAERLYLRYRSSIHRNGRDESRPLLTRRWALPGCTRDTIRDVGKIRETSRKVVSYNRHSHLHVLSASIRCFLIQGPSPVVFRLVTWSTPQCRIMVIGLDFSNFLHLSTSTSIFCIFCILH